MDAKKRSGKYVKFLMYIVVIVLLNLAGMTLFFRIDLTGNRMYSLSPVSRSVVQQLSEPLTIDVFFSHGLPAPYNSIERYLQDLLEEYGIYAGKYFNYRFYDVSSENGALSPTVRANQKMARDYGVLPIQIQVIEKDEVKFKQAYMGLVLIQGDVIEKIPSLTTVDGLEYKLTTAMQKLNRKISRLLSMSAPARVTLYLSSSLRPVAPLLRLKNLFDLPQQLKTIVEKVSAKNYGKLTFSYIDPSRDATAMSAIKKHNLVQLSWPDLKNGRIKAGSGAIGLVMTYGQKAISIPLLQVYQVPIIGTQYVLADLKRMPDMLADHLAALIDINASIGFVAGHGTLNVSGSNLPAVAGRQPDDVRNARRLISQTYSIKDIKPADGVPDSLDCLVIARPTEKFSDYELLQIDQFLMQGKNLAVFLDAFKEVRSPQMGMGGAGYLPVDSGLEKLLAHYGVKVSRSYVLDENCFKQRVDKQFGGGERKIYFAPLIKKKNINHALPFMKNINALVALRASPVVLDRGHVKKSGLKAYRLFASSAKSWEMHAPIRLNPMFLQPPHAAKLHSYALAYLLKGRFTSYFAGKTLPQKVVKRKTPGDKNGSSKKGSSEVSHKEKPIAGGAQKGKNKSAPGKAATAQIKSSTPFLAKGKPGRIFIVGSSEMLRDALIDEQGRAPNAIFLMNLLDDLNHRTGVARLRSKVQRFNPLAETDAAEKTAIKVFNIAGLPLLVSLCGLLVWSRRHARKKRIRKMFQQT